MQADSVLLTAHALLRWNQRHGGSTRELEKLFRRADVPSQKQLQKIRQKCPGHRHKIGRVVAQDGSFVVAFGEHVFICRSLSPKHYLLITYFRMTGETEPKPRRRWNKRRRT